MEPNLTLSRSDYDGMIFDLDGVITRTASVHFRAWKRLFDEYLKKNAGGGDWKPFDDEDYRLYVDGKPRYEGVKSFLESRGIDLPDGNPDDEPQKETLSDSMKDTLIDLAGKVPVAVISGRDRPDVQRLVGIERIFYAGSHGFDIAGPDGMETGPDKGKDFLPALDKAEKEVEKRLEAVSGAWVERKKFSIAVHYRKVQEPDVPKVKQATEKTAALHPDLRLSGGKKIFELQPKMDWHKGKALMWLLRELELDNSEVVPFYLGDDVTDEDAFRALKDRGIGVVVMDPPRETEAHYRLKNTDEVEAFLKKLVRLVGKGEQP